MKILLIEDDPDNQAALLAHMQGEGWLVDVCGDGEAAIEMGLQNDYHAVVLDPGLPIFSGEQVLKRWRTAGRNFPVLVVTGTRKLSDEWRELIRLGANNITQKPVMDYGVLLEWVRSMGNSISVVAGGSTLRHGDFEVDTVSEIVIYKGKKTPKALSGEEFAVLVELLRAGGSPLTPAQISERALDESNGPKDMNVPIYISRIRDKIDLKAISTARKGRGYFVSE